MSEENFMGLSFREFAEQFVKMDYPDQKECFNELINEYRRQGKLNMLLKKDKKAGGLAWLAQAIHEAVMNPIDYICRICECEKP
jgi:predicted AAA+ superfamily ATPase